MTDKILRAAANPLLVIRSQEPDAGAAPAKLSNVIVPLDGSKLAEEVLPHVVPIAKALSLNVILIRTVPTGAEYYSHFASSPLDGAPGAYGQAAEELSHLAWERPRIVWSL